VHINRKISKQRQSANDDNIIDKARRAEIVKKGYEGVKRKVAMCRDCGVTVHTAGLVETSKFLHHMFPGMSCMDIIHSPTGVGGPYDHDDSRMWSGRYHVRCWYMRMNHSLVREAY
jgi:hypothetical protein